MPQNIVNCLGAQRYVSNPTKTTTPTISWEDPRHGRVLNLRPNHNINICCRSQRVYSPWIYPPYLYAKVTPDYSCHVKKTRVLSLKWQKLLWSVHFFLVFSFLGLMPFVIIFIDTQFNFISKKILLWMSRHSLWEINYIIFVNKTSEFPL